MFKSRSEKNMNVHEKKVYNQDCYTSKIVDRRSAFLFQIVEHTRAIPFLLYSVPK